MSWAPIPKGRPMSSDSSCARISMSRSTRSASLFSNNPLRDGADDPHSPLKAEVAAATAASTSAVEAAASSARGWPVAGLRVENLSEAAVHVPPTNSSVLTEEMSIIGRSLVPGVFERPEETRSGMALNLSAPVCGLYWIFPTSVYRFLYRADQILEVAAGRRHVHHLRGPARQRWPVPMAPDIGDCFTGSGGNPDTAGAGASITFCSVDSNPEWRQRC